MPAMKGQRGQALLTVEDLQALAREHAGRCLSPEYFWQQCDLDTSGNRRRET